MRAVAAGAGKRPVVADLILREGADEQIGLAHVRQASLDVQRRPDEASRSPRPPCSAHIAATDPASRGRARSLSCIPTGGIAVKAIGHFLPHERRVLALRCLAGIEQGRARSPHHGRRDGARLMMPDDVEELVDVIETDDGHEGVRQLGMIRGGEVARRLVKIEVEREQRGQQVVLKARGPLANLGWHRSTDPADRGTSGAG